MWSYGLQAFLSWGAGCLIGLVIFNIIPYKLQKRRQIKVLIKSLGRQLSRMERHAYALYPHGDTKPYLIDLNETYERLHKLGYFK